MEMKVSHTVTFRTIVPTASQSGFRNDDAVFGRCTFETTLSDPFHDTCSEQSLPTCTATPNVVLSEIIPELRWQWKGVYALVGGAAADQGSAQMLERKREGPWQWSGQQGLKEEAGGRVTVVSQQSRHTGVSVHTWVTHIKAETLPVLLNACVQGTAVTAKAD